MSGDRPTGALVTRRLRARASRLSDRVADDIEAQILHGEIPGGALLPSEAELCDGFGVSRTVIRDALRTLDARGLIESRPGRGTTVREPNEESLQLAVLSRLMRSDLTMLDVVHARATIDIQLGPLAARNARPEHMAAARAAFAAFAAAVAEQRWAEVSDAHAAFHVALLVAIDVPALRVILSPLQQIVMLSALPLVSAGREMWADEVPLHGAIVDALEERDAAALRRAFERHYSWIAAYPDGRQTLFRDVPAVRDMVRSRFYRDGRRADGAS